MTRAACQLSLVPRPAPQGDAPVQGAGAPPGRPSAGEVVALLANLRAAVGAAPAPVAPPAAPPAPGPAAAPDWRPPPLTLSACLAAGEEAERLYETGDLAGGAARLGEALRGLRLLVSLWERRLARERGRRR